MRLWTQKQTDKDELAVQFLYNITRAAPRLIPLRDKHNMGPSSSPVLAKKKSRGPPIISRWFARASAARVLLFSAQSAGASRIIMRGASASRASGHAFTAARESFWLGAASRMSCEWGVRDRMSRASTCAGHPRAFPSLLSFSFVSDVSVGNLG